MNLIYCIMSQFTFVHIVNVEKRQSFSKSFTRMSDAIDYVKSFPRCKGCFIYAVRYNEVIAIKSDLAPLKVFYRDSDYVFEPHLFKYEDNHSILYEWSSSFSVPRYGSTGRMFDSNVY